MPMSPAGFCAQARAEVDVLAAAASWLDADPGARLPHVAPVLATVRLPPGEAVAKVRADQHLPWPRMLPPLHSNTQDARKRQLSSVRALLAGMET